MPLRATPFRAALAESRFAALLSLALFAVGVALRLRAYLDLRPLWLDEISLVLNIQGRSFAGLARPLDYDQTAPVAFLWVERLALLVGGVNELAVRAFPFVTGCLFLIVLWLLARRLFDVRGASVCLAFAALSPLLIYYSNEAKPYGSDALAAAILIWLALEVVDAPDSRRAWMHLAAGGVIAILFSTPSVFVLTGVVASLITQPVIRHSRSGRIRLAASGATWMAVFAVGYVALYRGSAASDFMQKLWEKSFLSMPPRVLVSGSIDGARRLSTATFLGRSDGVSPNMVLALVTLATLVGALALARRRGMSVVFLLTIPFLVTVAASMAHRWPLAPRLMIFLLPALILLAGAGLWTLVGVVRPQWRGAALAIMGTLSVLPASQLDAERVRLPPRPDDVAQFVRHVLSDRSSPAVTYVMAHSAPAWLYYSELWRERDGEPFRVAALRGTPSGDFRSRACVTQEPGLRVVFGQMPQSYLTDSAMAGEAAWLAAQPEREVWLLAIKYERKGAEMLTRELLARGAALMEERRRERDSLRRFRLPPRADGRPPVSCDVQPVEEDTLRAQRTQ